MGDLQPQTSENNGTVERGDEWREGIYFTEAEEAALSDLIYDAPEGFALVGFWCWRAGGHVCDESCKSDSVPLFAQVGGATGVRRNIQDDPDPDLNGGSQ